MSEEIGRDEKKETEELDNNEHDESRIEIMPWSGPGHSYK